MKYEDEDGSALEEVEEWSRGLKSRAKPAYNAAYQRDLRTIKRLGLSVTVKQYRESLK